MPVSSRKCSSRLPLRRFISLMNARLSALVPWDVGGGGLYSLGRMMKCRG